MFCCWVIACGGAAVVSATRENDGIVAVVTVDELGDTAMLPWGSPGDSTD